MYEDVQLNEKYIIYIDKMNEYLNYHCRFLALNLAIATLERINDHLSSSFWVRNVESMDTALSIRDCLTPVYKLQYITIHEFHPQHNHKMDKNVLPYNCLTLTFVKAAWLNDSISAHTIFPISTIPSQFYFYPYHSCLKHY